MMDIDGIRIELLDALDALDEVQLHEVSGSSPALALETAYGAADRAAAALRERCNA